MRAAPENNYWISGLSTRVSAAFMVPYLLLCGALIVYPLVRLAAFALGSGKGFGNFVSFFENNVEVRSLGLTVLDSALVTLCVLILGGFVAWCMRTTSSRFIKFSLAVAVFVPLWMSAITKIYAFTVLLQRMGIVNQALQFIGLVHEPVSWLYNQPVVIVGIVYQMLPYGVLPLYVTFSLIDLDLANAAEGLGASRLYAMISVILPLAAGGILVTGVMVYMISVGYFLTPVLLGGATSPFTASLISRDVFTYYDLVEAAVSGVLLIVVATVVAVGAYLIIGKDRLGKVVRG